MTASQQVWSSCYRYWTLQRRCRFLQLSSPCRSRMSMANEEDGRRKQCHTQEHSRDPTINRAGRPSESAGSIPRSEFVPNFTKYSDGLSAFLQVFQSSKMDLDLVSDIINGSEHARNDLPGNLLSNLPNRLTAQEEDASALEIPRLSSPVTGHTYRNLRNTPGAVISRIEDIFEAITDCLLAEGKELVIPLKSRPSLKNKPQSENTDTTTKASRPETRSITFPNKSPQEARRFSGLANSVQDRV